MLFTFGANGSGAKGSGTTPDNMGWGEGGIWFVGRYTHGHGNDAIWLKITFFRRYTLLPFVEIMPSISRKGSSRLSEPV